MGSYLIEMTNSAFSKDAKPESIKGIMNSSDERKETVETTLDLNILAPVITLSLIRRYRSLKDDTFSGEVVAAQRNDFSRNAVEKKLKKSFLV